MKTIQWYSIITIVLVLLTLSGLIVNSKITSHAHVMKFKYTSQLYPLHATDACEAASLKMALSVKNKALHDSLHTIINRMPKAKSNPNLGYTGNPYKTSLSTTMGTIYPRPLARYAREFGVRAKVITGASEHQLIYAVLHNNPVIFVGSWRMQNSDSYHVPVLMGYRPGAFLVADPYMRMSTPNKVYWVSSKLFMNIFNAHLRHQRAVEIE